MPFSRSEAGAKVTVLPSAESVAVPTTAAPPVEAAMAATVLVSSIGSENVTVITALGDTLVASAFGEVSTTVGGAVSGRVVNERSRSHCVPTTPFDATTRPGVYRWRVARAGPDSPGTYGQFVVNPNGTESRLAAMSPEALTRVRCHIAMS